MTDISDYEFVDKSGLHEQLKAFPKMVLEAYNMEVPLTIDMIPKSILVCGMGASGISGDILKNVLDTKVTVEVSKDYEIPDWVNSDTLVFIMSYSGNTEETIESYRLASSKRAKCVVISTGGKVEGMAKLKKNEFVKIPAGYQPRAALPYLFFAMLKVLSANKIISDKLSEVKNVVETLNKDWYEDNAKDLALKLKDRIPIIYGTKKLSSAVIRWKCQINENAKTHCFTNFFSELNHNEIVGYTHLNSKYHVIMLIDAEDSDKMKKRMDLTKDLIKSGDCEVTQIRIKGNSKLARIFSAIYLGDWTSFYLAVINEVDPTPVTIIENLKKRL